MSKKLSYEEIQQRIKELSDGFANADEKIIREFGNNEFELMRAHLYSAVNLLNKITLPSPSKNIIIEITLRNEIEEIVNEIVKD